MRSSIARWGALCVFVAATLAGTTPAQAVPPDPNDPGFGLQWNLQMVGAPAAWQRGTGSGVTIAIVDSGVDLTHPELKDKVIGHVSCVGSGGDESRCVDGGQDDNGHGTHVAGIAAAATDNGTGVAGVAPDALILDVKVLTQSCDPVMGCDASGNSEDVAAGIRYAADHGASVINLSLGEQTQSLIGPTFQSAIDYAFNKDPGAIPVIAAGNNFVLPSGGSLNAIVVGALDKDRTKSSYSNSIGDAQWALMAPGGEPDTADSCTSNPSGILSTYMNNGYACLAGTSMAAPHVSGAAAVLRSMGLTKQQTVDRLLSTARKMDPSTVYGAGALDLAAASGATTPVTPPPSSSSDATATSAGPPSSTSLDPAAPPENAPPSSSSGPPASVPSGDLGAPTSTTPAGVVTLPNQRAAGGAGGAVIRTPKKNGDISTGLVAAAVALAAGVSGAVLLFFFRSSSWTRRTPGPRRER